MLSDSMRRRARALRLWMAGPKIAALLGKAGIDKSFFEPRPACAVPAGASEALRPSHPELLALREAYRSFGGPAIRSSVWSEAFTSSEVPLLNFRGDWAYVWQRRDLNIPANYLLTAYYILAGPYGASLRTLPEDALFGAELVTVDRGFDVSRDLLDSVLEMAFLDRELTFSDGAPRTVLDIGAGYGRLGYRLTQAFPNVSVLATDAVPESTFLCGYYLNFRKATPRARAIPLHQIEETLSRTPVDVAVNIHAFSECTLAAIEWWLDLLVKYSVPYLMIVPNPDGHAGKQLLSYEERDDRRDFRPAIESRGYQLKTCEPKYANPELQRYAGVTPTHYHLFELRTAGRK